MTINDQHYQAAIVGTRRADSPEYESLLQAGGKAYLQQHLAGEIQHSHLSLAEALKPSPQTQCSETSARYLRQMLNGVHLYALPEFATLMRQMNRVAPSDLLPTLLKVGQLYEGWQPYLIYIIGRGGLWLGRHIHNQNWNWVTEWEHILRDPGQPGKITRAYRDEFFAVLQARLKSGVWRVYRDAAVREHPFIWTLKDFDRLIAEIPERMYGADIILNYLMYFLPADVNTTRLRKIGEAMGYEADTYGETQWQRLMKQHTPILTYRQRMHHDIQQAEQTHSES